MKNEIKQDYRAAIDILQSVLGVPSPKPLTALDDSIEQCRRWRRRLELATARNWQAAAKDSADRLRGALDVLRMRTINTIDELTRVTKPRLVPTAASVYRDIEGLRGEFEVVTVDLAKQQIAVQTANISLEHVELGSFEICLNWKFIKESSPYDVLAVEPNCPSVNDSVTHPHVQGESLCEGEGSDAIRRALDEGRVFDFFCIVDHVLRNYNPDSAYVQLEDWSGISCKACGDTVDKDEILGCGRCETELCLDCSTSCESCVDRFCSECISSCESCGDDVCQTCLKSCDDCGDSFCNTCLFEGTCDDCITKQNEASEEHSRNTEQTVVAVHAVRDGETAVPA